MHLLEKRLQFSQPLASPLVGLLLGAIAIPTSIVPLAVLVFDGVLQPHVATGLGIALFSAAVASAILAWRSSFENTLALPVPEEMVVLAAIAASVVETIPPGTDDRELMLSVVVAIALTSILTGSILWLLGRFHWGESIRFLPHPIVAGIFAGLGFLLIKGAFQVLLGSTGVDLAEPTTWGALYQSPTLWRWLPSSLLAVGLLALSRYLARDLALSLAVIGGVALFYLISWPILGISPVQVGSEGWLLGPFPDDEILWQPLSLQVLGVTHWESVLPQMPKMLAVVAISTLSLLLVSSNIELAAERDLDLNRELRAIGLANIVSGLGGGLVGSPSSASVQAYQWGARSRWVGVAAAASYLSVLLFGFQEIAFFPKPVLGALLLYWGLELLWRWLHDTLLRLSLQDYGLVLTIALVIATSGLLPGVAVGLVAAIVLCVVGYSQMNVARAALSGATYSSRVRRPVNQERLLRDRGEAIYILQLQGPIFLGTAYKLLYQLRQRLNDPTLDPMQYVILDCQWVSSMDASAILGFAKLRQTLRKEAINCSIAHLAPSLENQLRQGGALRDGDPDYACFPDLDRAMEWCENEIVAASKWRRTRTLPVVLQLKFLFEEDAEVAPTFVRYLEKVALAPRTTLFQCGDRPDALYFIESGQISTIAPLPAPNGPIADSSPPEKSDRRVQTLRAGTFVGELEFFTRTPYGLSAIADRTSTLYRLDRAALERMHRDDLQAALAFSRFINTLLAERLAQAQQEIARFFA